jgi:uncharacterized membrane protein YcgQ (UPF0703/DUF1980 family)
MRKVLVILFVILLLVGCSNGEDIIEIEERFFLAQVNHIRRNADEYIGRTIRYEGMFRSFHWPTTGDFHMVLRHTFGCCGNDGIVGFEVDLSDVDSPPYNAWVEVVGMLERYDLDGLQILRVVVSSITEMEVRGEEVVLS